MKLWADLGDRLVVGLRTLTPPTGVQIPLPQPIHKKARASGLFFEVAGGRNIYRASGGAPTGRPRDYRNRASGGAPTGVLTTL